MATSKLIVGCGYLGSRVAERWLEQGDEVFALTRSEQRAAEFRDQGLKPVVGDVTDPESLQNLPEVHTVLYAVGFDRSAEPSKREVYVTGLRNVLAALAPDTQRLIYISSTGVYGQCDGDFVDESSPAEPVTEGGRVCLEAEQLLVHDAFTWQWTVLRLAGIYGPKRIPRVDALKAGEPIAAPQSGYMNLIHVDDAARVVLATEQHASTDLYNVSDGHPVERGEYYKELARLVSAPAPNFVEPSPEHPASQRALSSKRISNRRMLDELSVKLAYPSYREGLAAIVGGEG